MPRELVDSNLAQVGGWLLFFVVIIAASSAAMAVMGSILLIRSGVSLLGVVAGAQLALGLYGGYCARALWNREPAAPSRAHWLMGLSVAITLLSAAITNDPTGAAQPIVFWIVWGTYLERSRRVQAVYRANAPAG